MNPARLTQVDDQPIDYEIRVRGQLDPQWSDWFDGLTISYSSSNETVISGAVVDQTALYGLLKKIRDLGLFLLSVQRLEQKNISLESEQCNE